MSETLAPVEKEPDHSVSYLQLKELLKKPGLAYVLYYTTACPPCVEMKTVFDWMANHELSPHKHVFTFARINIDQYPEVIGDLIDAYRRPWTIVYKNGQMVDQMIGMPVSMNMDPFAAGAYKKAGGT